MPVEGFLGSIFVALGFMSLVAYAAQLSGLEPPVSFWKLRPMQERWGLEVGTALHFITYVLAPIIFGAYLLTGNSL